MNDILIIGGGIGGLTLALELHHRNRRNPPDAILREIYERTGDRPFERVDAVISSDELKAISERYKGIAGYDKSSLQR